MRARILTDEWEAVGFGLPIVEFHDSASLARSPRLLSLGPDPLSPDFSQTEAVQRLREAGDTPIEEAILDQRRITGVGNVLKSETLFLADTYPYTPASALDDQRLLNVVRVAGRLLRENVAGVEGRSLAGAGAGRTTTRSMDSSARLYVYARTGKPCRRCGTPIQSRRAGRDARFTYWCPRCQPEKARGDQ